MARIYSTLKKRYTTEALRALRFRAEGNLMVKRGACRHELATASSLDGIWWRITPLAPGWKR